MDFFPARFSKENSLKKAIKKTLQKPNTKTHELFQGRGVLENAKHRAQWVSVLTEFRGENTVSSSQRMICVELTEFAQKLSEFSRWP